MTGPMTTLINRLFTEAAEERRKAGQEIAGQSPTFAGYVTLKGSLQPVHGAISRDETGLYKVLTVGEITDPGALGPRTSMLETFFHVEDVLSISVERQIQRAEPTSRIITS